MGNDVGFRPRDPRERADLPHGSVFESLKREASLVWREQPALTIRVGWRVRRRASRTAPRVVTASHNWLDVLPAIGAPVTVRCKFVNNRSINVSSRKEFLVDDFNAIMVADVHGGGLREFAESLSFAAI